MLRAARRMVLVRPGIMRVLVLRGTAVIVPEPVFKRLTADWLFFWHSLWKRGIVKGERVGC